jgi:hypothetical protein
MISLNSSSAGAQSTLPKALGTAFGSFLSLKDSKGTAGATFTATSSVDARNNSGWTITPQLPCRSLHASVTTPPNDFQNDTPHRLKSRAPIQPQKYIGSSYTDTSSRKAIINPQFGGCRPGESIQPSIFAEDSNCFIFLSSSFLSGPRGLRSASRAHLCAMRT